MLTSLKSSESTGVRMSILFVYLSDAYAGRCILFECYGIHAHGGRVRACISGDICMCAWAAHARNGIRAPRAPTSTEPAAGCKRGDRKDWRGGIAHSSNETPRLEVRHHPAHRQEAGVGPHRSQRGSRHFLPKDLPYGKCTALEAACSARAPGPSFGSLTHASAAPQATGPSARRKRDSTTTS